MAEPRAYLIKCRRDEDFYVTWSDIVEAPTWCGSRKEAAEFGYSEARIQRADEFGTSSTPCLDAEGTRPWHRKFHGWDSDGMIFQQRGLLPRRYLRPFTLLFEADELQAAYDLLEPLGVPGFTEVRRD